MTEQETLILKYRPNNWNDFYGNSSLIESLKSLANRKKGIPHCIMFEGGSGQGKTTLARIFASEIGCSDVDYREYNMALERGINEAREIRSKCRTAPLKGKVKVYVLDEVHMATKEFLNGMLKTLEEPPTHVYFILCTTEPEKIDLMLKTIRGQRASVFKVNPLNKRDMIKFLKDVVSKEIEGDYPDKLINEIANVSEGSPRKALNILDQIIDIEDDEKAYNAIIDSTVSETTIKELAQFLLKDGKKSEKELRKLLKNIMSSGGTVEDIRLQMAGYMNAVYLNGGNDIAMRVIEMLSEPAYYRGWFQFTIAIVTACGF